MKPILGIDITEDKKNETFNGSEFITAAASSQSLDIYEERSEALSKTIKKSKLPAVLVFIQSVCAIYFLFFLMRILDSSEKIKDSLLNAPILTVTAVMALIVWIALFILGKRKAERVLQGEETERQIDAIESNLQRIYEELEVPADAATVDILIFRYRIKDGAICPKELPLQSTPYNNLEVRLYVKGDCLCMADLENVYSFPLSSLRSIKTVNKRISVPVWNKEEEPTEGRFKPYKMTVNNMEDVFFKPYHILEIAHEGESYGLYFPCYELDVFEKVTGLRAEREEN